MPEIREFDNKIDGLKPDDRATQATVFAARHVGAEYANIGQSIGGAITSAGDTYEKIKSQQEISQGLATRAQIVDNLTTAWNVTSNNSDPNDHSTAEKWREEQLQPILDAWQTGFSTEHGRQWAMEQSAQMQQHFFEKTAADQSVKAGQAAKRNLIDFNTSTTNTLLQDPASLNTALGTTDMAIDSIIKADPDMTPEQAAALRGPIRDQFRLDQAKAAVIGTARADPDKAMADLQSTKYDAVLNAEQKNSLFGFAESIKREARADARAATAAQNEAQKQDFNGKVSAVEAQLQNPDGSMSVKPGMHQALMMLSQHPGAAFEPGRISSLEDAMARAVKDKIDGTYAQTNNTTWQTLASKIGQPIGSPGALTHAEVDQAYAAGNLSTHDHAFLKSAVEGMHSDPQTTAALTRLNQSLERVKTSVTQSNLYAGKLDRAGDLQYDKLHYDTFQRFMQLQQQGKSASEAADILTDPRNPNGIQHNLAGYAMSNKQGLQALHQTVTTGGAPAAPNTPNAFAGNGRKPGESAEAYLARTK